MKRRRVEHEPMLCAVCGEMFTPTRSDANTCSAKCRQKLYRETRAKKEGTMKIIRGKPATGKPPKIICTGCGKRAEEAGVAVPDSAVEHGYGTEGPVMAVEPDQMQPHGNA